MRQLPLPAWMLRILRFAFVGAGAFLAFRLLDPYGYGWTVPLGAGLLAIVWVGFRVRRVRRARAQDARADAWAEALVRPETRPAVLRELEAEVAALDPNLRAREYAGRALVLAELLEADGRKDEASEVLARVQTSELTEAYAAVVHHARSVAAISAGDLPAAERALDDIGGAVGDRAIDLRVRLLRGVIAVEQGDAARGLEVAQDALDDAGGDTDLAVEARVLRAMAQEADGDLEAALVTLRRLGDEMLSVLSVLSVLGLPRTRRLAEQALEAAASSEAAASGE